MGKFCDRVATKDTRHSSDAFRTLNDSKSERHDPLEDFDWAFKGSVQKRAQVEKQRFMDRQSAKAFANAIDPSYWRHGITINQGLGWNVSESNAKQRLNYIRMELLRAIFGNNFRGKGNIHFLVFTQGASQNGNQHVHALMAIEGKHDWSDLRIAQCIQSIEFRRERKIWEKLAHVDWDWKKGWEGEKDKYYKGDNFHRYVAREIYSNTESYYVL
jgi:hypothetical protein